MVNISTFDFYGVNFKFPYKGKGNHKTYLGGTLTLIFFFTLIYESFDNIYAMLKRETVSINSYSTTPKITDLSTLNDTNMILGISLSDANLNPLIFSKYFDFNLNLNSIDNFGNITKTPLSVYVCSNNTNTTIFQKSNINYLQNILCFNLSQNVIIGGNYFSNNFRDCAIISWD